jgi:hypothetical protein
MIVPALPLGERMRNCAPAVEAEPTFFGVGSGLPRTLPAGQTDGAMRRLASGVWVLLCLLCMWTCVSCVANPVPRAGAEPEDELALRQAVAAEYSRYFSALKGTCQPSDGDREGSSLIEPHHDLSAGSCRFSKDVWEKWVALFAQLYSMDTLYKMVMQIFIVAEGLRVDDKSETEDSRKDEFVTAVMRVSVADVERRTLMSYFNHFCGKDGKRVFIGQSGPFLVDDLYMLRDYYRSMAVYEGVLRGHSDR